jgi:hypothetical protein
VLHLKGLRCTRIVHISSELREGDGHGRGQKLAAIVPKRYSTREIGIRQEESVEKA